MKLTEDNELVIDVHEMSQLISRMLKTSVYYSKNSMPAKVILEIPGKAWEPKSMNSCEVDWYQVDWTPPKYWWTSAGKASLDPQYIPDPDYTWENIHSSHIGKSEVHNDPSNVQPKRNLDEMMVVRAVDDQSTQVVSVNPVHDTPPPPKDHPSDIEHLDGNIHEEIILTTDTESQSEEATVDNEPDEKLPNDDSGLERTGELDRASQAIDTAGSPTSQHDGQE